MPWLEKLVNVPVYAKYEHQQITGSFKYRGAVRAVLPHGRSVAAGSAGNHGLAVATVAQQLGVDALVVVPTNASTAKRERITATGAALIDHGESVQEAGEHARALAEARGLDFISPYNNPALIGGGAELASEFMAQVPELRHLVLPVGGGGLLSGAVEATRGGQVSILACEPERHAAMARSLAAGAPERVLHQPTIADGLAINLDRDTVTVDRARGAVATIVELTEEELAAGTLAMLVRESTLVEPAGAAAVIAALRLAQRGLLTGPVGIPLTGGNMQHSTLARIQRWDYTDPDLLNLLELRGRTVDEVVIAPSELRMSGDALSGVVKTSPAEGLDAQLESLEVDLQHCTNSIANYAEYCRAHRLVESTQIIADLRDTVVRAEGRAATARKSFAGNAPDAGDLVRAEIELKAGRATVAFSRSALEWSCPSYAQAVAPQFFDERSQDSPRLNYDRYEHSTITRIERQLAAALGDGGRELAATAVSSGMAAYSLIESFLIRHRLEPGARILLAPYIYFEATEQLLSLPGVSVHSCTAYTTEHVIEQVRRQRPRIVFLDPIANNPQLRCIDVIGVVESLRDTVNEPVTVVIDGTMTSGALSAEFLRPRGQIEVLYYESGSKYLQMGLDSAMAGVCIHPADLAPRFDRLRRNTGAILYRTSAEQFPPYTPQQLIDRMLRIAQNAVTVANVLTADPRVRSAGMTYYPGHPSHPDHDRVARLRHCGGCVTFVFDEPGLNNRDLLNALIDRVISWAQRDCIPLTKGVSFGFTVPRLSAAASMNETDPPFLRIYAGDLGPSSVTPLAQLLAKAIHWAYRESC